LALNRLSPSIAAARESEDPRLTVRIIGVCNFRCPACSTFSSPERKGLLPLSELKQIIDILVRENFHGALHFSGGETTLHPDLKDMVTLAARDLRNSRIVVFTNGDWVGAPGWTGRLQGLFAEANVLVRFSLDRQHAVGKSKALFGHVREKTVADVEKERLEQARSFLAACLALRVKPGLNFDFAFKGTLDEAKKYMRLLGDVPVYPIQFQKSPARRPKHMGTMAVDLDSDGRARVFVTLGHIPRGEALGGIQTLPLALRMNRRALRASA